MLVLSPIILIHELGHFMACKWSGIRVEEFSFGLGNKLWSKKRGDTEFTIRAVPFGGFVKTSGEMFLAKDSDKPKEWEFAAKKWWVKLIMVISGALMNYVLAFVIFSGVTMYMGSPQTDAVKLPTVVGEVVKDMPAAAHGLASGDKILALNEYSVSNWKELIDSLDKTTGDVSVKYLRGTEEMGFTVKADEFKTQRKLGIMVQTVMVPVGFFGSIKSGAQQCWYWTYFSISSIGKSISKGKAPDLAGPVGIVNIVHKAVRTNVVDFIFLIGLLSLAVGMFNLFPIPVLDGGYAIMFIIEGIRGKQIPLKTVEKSVNVGFGLLMLLVLYATFKDVDRLGAFSKIMEWFK